MNSENLIFYHVSDAYIEYLRFFVDSKVLFNKSENNARPYVGFVIEINDINYLVPLSSKIRKSNEVTTVIPNTFTEAQKLKNAQDKKFSEQIATIKFNSMIPVFSDVIEIIDLDKLPKNRDGENYKNLLIKEMLFCSENRDKIIKKAQKTYSIYISKKHYMKEIIESCCNFDLLREKMQVYKDTIQIEKEMLIQASVTEDIL